MLDNKNIKQHTKLQSFVRKINNHTLSCFTSKESDIFETFLRATAECFACLSHRLGVCLSVCHTRDLYQNSAS